VLFRTLFSPWRRIQEEYRKGFDLGEFAETLIVNTIMRLVGAFFRIVLICIGLLALLLMVLLGIALLFVWVFLPVIIIALFINGISLLF